MQLPFTLAVPLLLAAVLACETPGPVQGLPPQELVPPEGPELSDRETRDIAGDVEPAELWLRAFSVGDRLLIVARGENTTSGFQTELLFDPDGTPRLRNAPPPGIATQVITPFEAAAWYEEREGIPLVRVRVADKLHEVPVRVATRLEREGERAR